MAKRHKHAGGQKADFPRTLAMANEHLAYVRTVAAAKAGVALPFKGSYLFSKASNFWMATFLSFPLKKKQFPHWLGPLYVLFQ